MADNQVVITRTFNAPIEKVWAAWTEPEQIEKWWGPKDFTAPHITIDFREGGKYLYAMHGPAGTPFDVDMWSAGTFTEIVPQRKIAYTDHFADADGNMVSPASIGMAGMPDEMHVTLEFEPTDDGKTKLTLTHEGPAADSEHAKNMTDGWNQSLDKFTSVVEA